MVLQNYQNLIEMTSNMFYLVAFGVGFKCPRKIHLNTHSAPPGCNRVNRDSSTQDLQAMILLLPGQIMVHVIWIPIRIMRGNDLGYFLLSSN